VALVTTMGAGAAVAATPTVAPAGGMGSGYAAGAAIMARPTTGMVTIEAAGGSALDAVLGTAATSTNSERDAHPSNSPALGTREALPTRRDPAKQNAGNGGGTEQPRHARSTGMSPRPHRDQATHRLRFERPACPDCLRHHREQRSTKLIGELPSAAIEAIWMTSKEQHCVDRPRTAVERTIRVTAALGALSMAPSIGLCADPGHSPGLTGPGDEQNSTGCFYVGTYGMSDVGLRQEAVGADRIQAYLDRHQHTKSCAAAPGFMWMSCESC
jgi:hypothetical protein